MARPMTLEEIEALPKDMLIPTDIAGYLGCAPYAINIRAQSSANPFPFPVIVLGRRVKIPKQPFIKVMRGNLFILKEENK